MMRPVVLALLLVLAALPAHAGERHDHERARAALLAGEVMPLGRLLDRLAQTNPGDLLEAELEDEHGRLVYELKLLTPGGRVQEILVDARTGEPLASEPRHR